MSENTERRYLKWYNKVGYGSGDVAATFAADRAARLYPCKEKEEMP